MSINLNEFKSNLLGGGSRPNQFRARIAFPTNTPEAGSGITGAESVTQFLIQTAQLPSSNIGVAPVFYRGRQVPFAGDREFEPWSVTILNDTDFKVRKALEEWVASMGNNARANGKTSGYRADLYVEQLDRDGTVLRTYRFVDAFPTNVDAIELSMDDNDNISRYGATFQYVYWEIDQYGGANGGKNGSANASPALKR